MCYSILRFWKGLRAFGAAFLLVLPRAAALHCEPFDLSAPGGERSHFEKIWQQTPSEILAPARHALMLLSRESRDPVGDVEAFRHAEALSEYAWVLQAVYKQSGDPEILRALLTVREGALRFSAPGPASVLRLADALFDLCRPVLRSAQRSLALFLQAEELSGQMCNAKVVLQFKQLGQWEEGERYAKDCGLSITHLHLQHPRLQTMPWWNLKDPRLPKWLRGIRFRHAVHIIRTDLQKCLERTPSAFDDSANDWFFVGSRFKWTGLNLMHSARGGWNERWCGEQACAKQTCDMLRWRKELNHSLWPKLSHRAGIPSESSPPMYVNFYALTPGSHILPHLGNDGRLTIHLALHVPLANQSRIRVANQTINYTHAGQMLVFDDAYDHEVWNDGKTTRYVLGVTIWHPSLLFQLPPSEVPPEVPDSHFALSWITSSDRKARSSICRGRVICAGSSGFREKNSTTPCRMSMDVLNWEVLACIRLLDVAWVATEFVSTDAGSLPQHGSSAKKGVIRLHQRATCMAQKKSKLSIFVLAIASSSLCFVAYLSKGDFRFRHVPNTGRHGLTCRNGWRQWGGGEKLEEATALSGRLDTETAREEWMQGLREGSTDWEEVKLGLAMLWEKAAKEGRDGGPFGYPMALTRLLEGIYDEPNGDEMLVADIEARLTQVPQGDPKDHEVWKREVASCCFDELSFISKGL